MDPERSHQWVMRLARWLPFLARQPQIQRPVKVFGITFPNPIGLAAGFDKNAEHLQVLSKMGFGSIEVGSVTPLPQDGNPKPRLQRLTDQEALINRMGLNNIGIDQVVRNLRNRPTNLILGASFTKNTATRFDQAIEDYRVCLERLYPVTDYLVADVSCPNTGELEASSNLEFLEALSASLKTMQRQLHIKQDRYVPLLLKLSSDWDQVILEPLTQILIRHSIDGVICGNTSHGLSGRPLFPKALALVKTMGQLLAGRIPIIGVGGISTRLDLLSMQEAGAELFQIYTALVYRGPQVVSELLGPNLTVSRHPPFVAG